MSTKSIYDGQVAKSRVVNVANLQQFTAINVLSDPGVIGGPVVIPGVCRVILRWGLESGKTGHNVLAMSVAAGFNPTPAIAEQMRVAIVAGSQWSVLAGFLAISSSLQGVDLLDIRTAGTLPVSSTGAATPGTSASAAMPNEVAVVLTIRTAQRGPGGRGRFYVPGFATNALATGNVVAPAVITALQTWTGNINTAMQGAGGAWVLAQPARVAYTGSTGTQHPARSATFAPMTSVLCRDNHWDTQRRRGLK